MNRQQQAGIVSIIVATMLIVIVSLIVIAFAQVSRREQRESLDAQLSSQAYYAAETGVNAAGAIVQDLLTSNPAALSTPQKECKAAASSPFSSINYTLNAANDVAITCLTVDPAPTDLTYTLSTDKGTVVPVIPASGAAITSLTFSWPMKDGAPAGADQTDCRSTYTANSWSLPSENVWNSTWGCPFAAIRADLVPGSSLDRASLLNNDIVSLMLPVNAGTGTGKFNDVSPAKCISGTCTVTYAIPGYSRMYLRLVSVYLGGETVTITGKDTSGDIGFTGAQAKIDSTGRAQDVLRRIVVAAPLQSGNDAAPVQALVSGDSVCKRFGVFTGFYQNYAPATAGCN